MKCYCCNHEFPDGKSACPVCGFPVIYGVDGNQLPMDQIAQQVQAYRAEKMENIEISAAQYYWKESGDGVAMDRKVFVKVADGKELSRQGTVWLDQKFARIVSQKKIPIEYKRFAGDKVQKATVPAPQDVSFWKLGAELADGMSFRFVLQSDGETTQSDPQPLL